MTKTAKTTAPMSVAELTIAEYRELVLGEHAAVEGCATWLISTETMREAYEARERRDFRCVCCGAYVAPVITGDYDGSTCLACGLAQELYSEDDDPDDTEHVRVAAAHRKALRAYYAKKFGATSYDRAKKALDAMFWATTDRSETPRGAAFPTFAVNNVRRWNAEFGR